MSTPAATLKKSDYEHVLSNLVRETGRSRDECADAYQKAGNLFQPAKTILLKESVIVTPSPLPERKRTPAPPKETPRPTYTPPPSAFPKPVPSIPVQLPGDGSPEAIRDYFNATSGVKRTNSTAERTRRLCGKLAEAANPEGYRPVGDWRAAWDTCFKTGEDCTGNG